MASIKRIHIFANRRQRDIQARDALSRQLQERGFELVGADPELVVSVGGDGTFLEAVRRYRQEDVAFVGVNSGRLGFLQQVDSEHLHVLVDHLANDDYDVVHFPLLAVTVENADSTHTAHVFNDVVVERRSTRTIRLQLHIEGVDCGKVLGDGIIVATPAGSTAYASAAGGAIVHPSSPVLQVIPLNPHDSTIYQSIRTSMVLPMDSSVSIRLDPAKERQSRVVMDGEACGVDAPEQVEVRQAEAALPVLQLDPRSFWDRLFTKIIGRHPDD